MCKKKKLARIHVSFSRISFCLSFIPFFMMVCLCAHEVHALLYEIDVRFSFFPFVAFHFFVVFLLLFTS